MDQIKIGRFIAELRKEKNLTQRQLADSLNLSDKTISKWECGKGLPEVSLMLPLCEILEITVNELLCGERIEKEVYEEKADDNVIRVMEEKNREIKKLRYAYIIYTLTYWLFFFAIRTNFYPLEILKLACRLFQIHCVLQFIMVNIRRFQGKIDGEQHFLGLVLWPLFFVVGKILYAMANAIG